MIHSTRAGLTHRTSLSNLLRALGWASALGLCACGDDPPEPAKTADASAVASGGADAGAAQGASVDASATSADAAATDRAAAGRSGMRSSGLSCPARPEAPIVCDGQECPHETEYETNECFVACCLQVNGRESCGLRGTSRAFTTECVAAAVPDPSCDEVVQFQGCCNLAEHKCGIIGGFSPGCTLESSFVTLPKAPKSCGLDADDAGTPAASP